MDFDSPKIRPRPFTNLRKGPAKPEWSLIDRLVGKKILADDLTVIHLAINERFQRCSVQTSFDDIAAHEAKTEKRGEPKLSP